jgi:hypothetical protein
MEKCMREYCLRYIQKYYIKIPQPWNNFGSLAHAVGEQYRGGGRKEINRLLREVNRKKDGTKKWHVHDDYKHKMPLAYSNMIKFYDTHLRSAQKIARELELRTDISKYVDVTAFLDILYKNEEGEWVITDYKTSKKKIDGTKQLSFYYALLELCQGKVPKKMKGQIVYLALDYGEDDVNNFVEEYELSDYELKYAYNRIQAGLDKISIYGLDKNNWVKKESALCPYCDYLNCGLCDGKE